MVYKILKYTLLSFVGFTFCCCGNDHYRSRSDYHFFRANCISEAPSLTVKLKKCGPDDFLIQSVQEEVGDTFSAADGKECTLKLFLMEKEQTSNDTEYEKKLIVKTSDGREFKVEIKFSRQFQLINFDVGLGKIYRLKNISTDLPSASVKTVYEGKILYTACSYPGENVVEIEY